MGNQLTPAERAVALASAQERRELFDEEAHRHAERVAAAIARALADVDAGREPPAELLEAAADAPTALAGVVDTVTRQLEALSDSVELGVQGARLDHAGTEGDLRRDATGLRCLAATVENLADLLRFRRAARARGWID